MGASEEEESGGEKRNSTKHFFEDDDGGKNAGRVEGRTVMYPALMGGRAWDVEYDVGGRDYTWALARVPGPSKLMGSGDEGISTKTCGITFFFFFVIFAPCSFKRDTPFSPCLMIQYYLIPAFRGMPS